MAGATSIVIVRDDFSIPGVVRSPGSEPEGDGDVRLLVETLQAKKPDVVVLDCRGPTRNGLSAIEQIRSFTMTPILVIHEIGDPLQRDYEISGVAGCLPAPFDIQTFNGMLLEISGANRPLAVRARRPGMPIRFNGLLFRPNDDTLVGGGLKVQLTTAESRLLLHLLQHPWKACSRLDISGSLYGPHRPVSDRAIDAIVARLRKKLAYVQGEDESPLIKTEFRLGFSFVGQLEETAVA